MGGDGRWNTVWGDASSTIAFKIDDIDPRKRLGKIHGARRVTMTHTTPHQFFRLSQGAIALVGGLTLALTLGIPKAWAGDPFRGSNPRNINDQTETAFEAIFQQGNYGLGKQLLDREIARNPQEPLTYALRGAIAYTESDWRGLKTNADRTLATAEKLKGSDPLRGNLYLGIGTFLDGAHAYLGNNVGVMGAFGYLQRALGYMAQAEKVDKNDPELNLFKGYMDLLLAVHLPFSNPEQAIARFQSNASPDYLVQRGIAVAYRDLGQYPQALSFVNLALANYPQNPELHYLKGQILYQHGKNRGDMAMLRAAVSHFDQAIAKAGQLPSSITETLRRERTLAQTKINQL